MPSTLTFTPADGNVPKTVQVVAVHDADLEGAMVPVTVSSAGLPAVTVAVQVVDADAQDILVDATAVTIPEGGSTQVGVRLAFAPPSGTIVQVASTVPAHVGVAPSVLTFTAANYSVAQPVTITADRDLDLDNLSAQVVLQTGALTKAIGVLVQDTTVAVTIGFPNFGGGAPAGLDTTRVYAQPFQVTTALTVTSTALFGTASSVRMAIYRDSGGFPGTRLVTSSSATASQLPTATSMPTAATQLTPGNYWFAVLGASSISTVPGTSVNRCTASILTGGFPDSSSPLFWSCQSSSALNLSAAGVQ
jgi:hypothetical protein